ncbi:MAG: VTT domain-containing protein [Clostridiaceae bacterium]
MNNKKKGKIDSVKNNWAGGVAVLIALFTAAFLYIDRGNEITDLIQTWGTGGIFLAILLMAGIFMTPIPSEGIIVLYLKIYGVYLGTLYSWIGSIISTLAFYFLARKYGQKLMKKLITQERFEAIDDWVENKGTFGLLIARFLPIPAFFVNCIAGTMPSVKFWEFIWTAAVAIIPYFLGIALVFTGVASGSWKWIVFGVIVEAVCLSAGYFITRKRKNARDNS